MNRETRENIQKIIQLKKQKTPKRKHSLAADMERVIERHARASRKSDQTLMREHDLLQEERKWERHFKKVTKSQNLFQKHWPTFEKNLDESLNLILGQSAEMSETDYLKAVKKTLRRETEPIPTPIIVKLVKNTARSHFKNLLMNDKRVLNKKQVKMLCAGILSDMEYDINFLHGKTGIAQNTIKRWRDWVQKM